MDSSVATPEYTKGREKAWLGMPVALRMRRICNVIHLSITVEEYFDAVFEARPITCVVLLQELSIIMPVAMMSKKEGIVCPFILIDVVVIVNCFIVFEKDY